MKDLYNYLDSKSRFEHYIKEKIEGRCHMNNKGWAKLTDFHLNNFLKELENPFGFLYNVKSFHKKIYSRTPCMVRYYNKYKRRRQLHWDLMKFTMKGNDGELTEFTITSNDLTKQCID